MKSAIYRAMQLPLLTIELQQMAASKRTYIIRFVYAATLFGVASWLFFYKASDGVSVRQIDTSPDYYQSMAIGPNVGPPTAFTHTTEPKVILGSGGDLFETLVLMQFFALCVVIPATTCGVIAEERQKNTLGVLLLSPLGGFQVVLQKLLSRLVPMFSFVLLSLPLLAVAYSYGGVGNRRLFMGVILLLLTCAQMGSLSVLMSVLCRTTVTAMVGTYLVFIFTVFSCTAMWPLYWLNADELTGGPLFLCVLLTGGCYIAASVCLTSRVFQSGHNYFLQLQRELDRFAQDANRLVGDVQLLRKNDGNPEYNAVQWRETERRPLGTLRYQLRMLALVLLPLIAIAWTISNPIGLTHSVLRGILWLGSFVLLGVHTSSLIAGERSSQTLNILLTTPIEGRSILLEKTIGLRRLVFILAIPVAMIAVLEYLRIPVSARLDSNGINVLWSIVTAVVWLPATAWFGLFVSTRVRSATRATLIVLITLGGVLLVPAVLASIAATGGASDTVLRWIAIVSPTQIQGTLSPFTRAYFSLPTIPVWAYLVHLALVAGLGILCRFLALRDIDATLGRIPEGFTIDESRAPKEALQPASS